MKHNSIPAPRLDLDVRSRRLRALTHKLHREMELMVAIGRRGVNSPAAEALDHEFGYMRRFCIDFAWNDAQRHLGRLSALRSEPGAPRRRRPFPKERII
jgi:2-keto-4-pentenoate hydratase/2-oxohepta-3-ene-1,7-dioic acid hydratase in catechol pathway